MRQGLKGQPATNIRFGKGASLPRFTPWHSGVPPDHAESEPCLNEVIRPGLRQAFPLPAPDHADDERFCMLLEALGRGGDSTGPGIEHEPPSAS